MPSEYLPVGTIPKGVSEETLTEALKIGYNDAVKAASHKGETLDKLTALMANYQTFVTRDGFD